MVITGVEESQYGRSQVRSSYGREYVWPSRPPHELIVPSATTVLRYGLPKTALQYWTAQVVAEYAYDHVDSWRTLPRPDAVDLLKRSPYRNTRRKAMLGSALHAAIDAFLRGEAYVSEIEEQRGYMRGAIAFLQEWKPTVIRTEATVFSRAHRYGGTSDLLALVDDEPTIVDYKTGSGIYPEHALQLAAYANADFIGDADDTETPLERFGIFRRGLLVKISDDGTFEVHAIDLDRELFETFLAAKQIYLFNRHREGSARSAPTTRGEPMPVDSEPLG